MCKGSSREAESEVHLPLASEANPGFSPCSVLLTSVHIWVSPCPLCILLCPGLQNGNEKDSVLKVLMT